MEGKKSTKIILVVIVILLILAILGGTAAFFIIKNLKKHKKIIPEFGEAIVSEEKMEKFIKNNVDLKGAVAWQKAGGDSKDFESEYKDIDKDADEIEKAEDKLLKVAKLYEKAEDVSVSIKNIGDPKEDNDNKKIYTVSAKMEMEKDDESESGKLKFVFYKNKVIDITLDDSSIFEGIVKNKSSKVDDDDDDDDDDNNVTTNTAKNNTIGNNTISNNTINNNTSIKNNTTNTTNTTNTVINTKTSSNEDFEKPIKNMVDGMVEGNSQKFLKAFPPFYAEYMGSMFTDEYLKENVGNLLNVEGYNINVTYRIKSKSDLPASDLEKMQSDISTSFKKTVSITKGYKVQLEIVASVSGHEETEPLELSVYCIDGEWYILGL